MICQAVMRQDRAIGPGEEAALLRRRDPETLHALVTRYQHRLYRYLLRVVRNPAAAEDLFQQTWLRVVEKASGFDVRREFEPWLFSIAHNLAIDFLRRRSWLSLDDSETPALPDAGPGAFEGYLAGERAAAVAAAMEELPPSYRETLALRFEEEMKLEEIAEAVGAPVPTVKSRLRRALIELRSRVERRTRRGVCDE